MTFNWMILAGFFIFVLAMASVAVYILFGRKETESITDGLSSELLLVSEEPERGLKDYFVLMFHGLGAMMPSSESARKAMEQRLSYAGYRGAVTITSYFGVKCACALVLGLALALIAWQRQTDMTSILVAAICGMGLGFLVPERVLDALVSSRNDRLRRALPAGIDLVVMGLEAGQPLDQSLVMSSRGLEKFSPELAAELLQVHLETRASKTRADAIRHMSERNGEPELRKFAQLLIDSERFGSSLAPTLRQHAKYLRVRFRQRAQEQARKLTVKMVFPVFFLIFPSILVITLAPAVLTLMKTFRGFGE